MGAVHGSELLEAVTMGATCARDDLVGHHLPNRCPCIALLLIPKRLAAATCCFFVPSTQVQSLADGLRSGYANQSYHLHVLATGFCDGAFTVQLPGPGFPGSLF